MIRSDVSQTTAVVNSWSGNDHVLKTVIVQPEWGPPPHRCPQTFNSYAGTGFLLVLHEKVASVKWLSSYVVTVIYKILLICPLDAPLPGKLGGSVLLKPNASAEIASITWKQGPDLAVQWDGTNLNSYRQFKSLLDWSLGCFLPLCKLVTTSVSLQPGALSMLRLESWRSKIWS